MVMVVSHIPYAMEMSPINSWVVVGEQCTECDTEIDHVALCIMITSYSCNCVLVLRLELTLLSCVLVCRICKCTKPSNCEVGTFIYVVPYY